MDELKFVLKGFVFAVLATMLLQVSVGGETLETKSDRMLHHSSVGNFLNQTAQGAAILIKKGTQMAQGLMGQSKKESSSSKSSGWKIETRHQRISSENVDTEGNDETVE